MDRLILEALQNYDQTDIKAALATIIDAKGSTPRGDGATMLIYADGKTVGTIGGGCAEAEAKQAALLAMDKNEVSLHHVDLNADLAAEEGMVCGGSMNIFLEPINDPTPYQLLNSLRIKNDVIYSALVIGGDETLIGQRAVFDKQGFFLGGASVVEKLKPEWLKNKPNFVTLNDGEPNKMRVFLQPINFSENLLILGAGHIGQALATMAILLDFEVTVVDDRADFANQARFPGVNVICNSFAKTLESYNVNSSTYIVVVTRGHRYDEECLKMVVSSPAAYIGLIGSRRRTRLLLQQLEEGGYSKQDLERVITPIGLDIGAETPSEIAISILAEIIMKKRKGQDYFLEYPKTS